MSLAPVDYVILALYCACVLGIGWRCGGKTSSAPPLWITSLAFLAANLGIQEIIGMSAAGAKYGLMTAHFYWIGAVPAMIFVGLFMMPIYYGSRVRSIPEYLKLRFDEKTQTLNAVSFAIIAIVSSGISMYALGTLFEFALGWKFAYSVLASAAIVLAYTSLGGLRGVLYTQALQFFLIVLGLAPLAVLALGKAGGWSAMAARLPPGMTETWQPMGHAYQNPMGVETFGMTAGLGFVISFGYWCTDFRVVQRALAADSLSAAQRTPILAAFPRMLMAFVVVVPGIVAVSLQKMNPGYALPIKWGWPDYDQVLTSLMAQLYPAGMRGIGIAALMAAFMSGVAANITAFTTVVVHDIFRKTGDGSHHLMAGRLTGVAGVLLSIAAAYVGHRSSNILDLVQLVFSFVSAPLFATFLLGMFWKRATGHGAFFGLLAGATAAAATHGLTVAEQKGGWLWGVHSFSSTMAQNFWVAIFAWLACFLVTIGVSLATKPRAEEELRGLVYCLTEMPADSGLAWYRRPLTLACIAGVALLVLNLWFW